MSAVGAPRFDRDGDLVARAQAGDHAAFEQIVASYQTAILHYIYRMLGLRDFEAARDLTQDTFVKAWRKIGDTDAGLLIGPWLYRIAQRTCLDELRHRKVVRFVPLVPLTFLTNGDQPSGGDEAWEIAKATTTTGPGEPEHEALGRERVAEVWAALDRLPPTHRTALMQHEMGGLSIAEMSARTGLAYSGIKSLLTRARASFLKEYRRTHPEAATVRPLTGPRSGRPRSDGLPLGSGISRKRGKVQNPWIAQPYDAPGRCTRYVGCFPTQAAALAAVAAWRAQQQQQRAA